MAEQDGVRIPVELTIAGADAAAAGVGKVTEATQAATAAAKENAAVTKEETAALENLQAAQARTPSTADRLYNRDLTASAAAAMATPEEDAAEQRAIAAEERRNALISQRRAILEQELELLNAERAGNAQLAAELERDIAIRREALGLQRAGVAEEEEAMALAEQRVTAEAEITAQKAKQAAEDAEGKVFGGRNRLAQMGRNFGLDANAAATAGIGLFAGMAAEGAINGMIEKIEQETAATARLSAEIGKQVEGWRESAKSANSMGDVVSLVNSMTEAMDKLKAKAEETPLIGTGMTGMMDKLKADYAALTAGNPILDVNGSEAFKTSGEKQQAELEKRAEQMRTTIVKLFEDSKRSAEEMAAIMSGPLDQGIEQLQAKINALAAGQANQNLQTVEGIAEYTKLQGEIENLSGALDKLNAAKAKRDDAAEKEAKAQAKATEKAEEMKNELFIQQQLLQAMLDDDEKRTKEIERQLQYTRDLKRLGEAGVPDAAAEAAKLQALRDQLDVKKAQQKADEEAAADAAKLQKINDDDAITHAKARHNESALFHAERNKAQDEQRKKLEDAGLSGPALEEKLRGEMHDYDRLHGHGRIDGHAPQARVKDGLDNPQTSASHDPNDTLRSGENGPSPDFQSLTHGGPHSSLGGGNNTASADFQKLKPLDDKSSQGGTGGGKGGEDVKAGGADVKAGGKDVKEGGEAAKTAGEQLKTAVEKFDSSMQKVAADFAKAIANMPKGGGGGGNTPTDNTDATNSTDSGD